MLELAVGRVFCLPVFALVWLFLLDTPHPQVGHNVLVPKSTDLSVDVMYKVSFQKQTPRMFG